MTSRNFNYTAMRIFIFFCISFFLSINLLAQESFSEVYGFNGSGTSFKNILLVEDTLILIGNYKSTSSEPWEVLFAKIDTAGNVLDFKTHTNEYDDHFTLRPTRGFIKTSDGGYATTPRLHNRGSITLMKLDVNGELAFLKEYESENYRHFQKIIEVEGGYLLGGHTLITGIGYNFLITRTDLSGEIIWEKEYEISTHDEFLHSFIKVDDNTFVIGGIIKSRGIPEINAWRKSVIFAIDSLGEEKWIWEGPLSEESFVNGLHQSEDGGWVYATGTHYSGIPGSKKKLVKHDADFNLLWEKQLNVYIDSGGADSVRDVKPMPDGSWVACGQYWWPDPFSEEPDDFTWLNGFLHKVSDEGESLWSMRDTVFFSPVESSFNYLSGLVVLPSGSVIAAGHADDTLPRSWAWLMKVDKNGCLDTLCTITGVEDFLIPQEKVNIFPNPFYDEITIDFEGNYAIEIYDTFGRLVKRKPKLNEVTVIKLTALTAGAYFMKIYSARGVRTKKIIKIE